MVGELVQSEAVGRSQRRAGRRRVGTEQAAPVPLQRVREDGLDRHALVGGRKAAATGGLAHAGPIGGAEAGAGVVARIAIGFQQGGPVAIALEEVLGQAPQDHAEHLGGEQVTADGGTDQEPAQGQHAVQSLAAHRRRPANPLVAGRDRQGRGGKADRPQHAVLGLNQVAQLGPDVDHGALRVLAGDQFVPGLPLWRGRHQGQLQAGQRPDGGGNRLRCGDRLAESPGTAVAVAAAMARGRQLDASLALQTAQGFLAIRHLEFAASVEEAEFPAHVAGERGPAGVAGLRQQHLEGRDGW